MSDKVDDIPVKVKEKDLEELIQIKAYDMIRETLEDIGRVLSWDLNGLTKKIQAIRARDEGIKELQALGRDAYGYWY